MEIVIQAPRDYTGHGVTAAQIAKALTNIGVKVRFVQSAWSVLGNAHESEETKDLLDVLSEQQVSNDAAILYYGLPAMPRRFGKEKHFLFLLWEVSHLPPEWVGVINMYDGVITCIPESKKAFERSGVKIPIFLAPLGVDYEKFKPVSNIRFRDDKKTVMKYFTFLSIFEWNYRKGYDVLIKAFEEEFADDLVNLVLRTYSHRNFTSVIAGINRYKKNKRSRIFLLKDLVREDMVPLMYNAANCFVLVSRGEGMGQTALEAEACGLPVVLSDCTGLRSLVTEDYPLVTTNRNLLGNHSGIYEWYRPWMEWDDPTVESTREIMRAAYDGQLESLRRNSIRYTWEKTAKAIVKAIGG